MPADPVTVLMDELIDRYDELELEDRNEEELKPVDEEAIIPVPVPVKVRVLAATAVAAPELVASIIICDSTAEFEEIPGTEIVFVSAKAKKIEMKKIRARKIPIKI